MADKFDAQVDKMIANTKEKMLAVVKNSIQEVVREAQTPVNNGGKMHVDTGFLRHSGAAALNNIPVGETEGRKRLPGEEGILPEYTHDEKETNLLSVLVNLKYGDIFYYGWTARYAQIRNMYDGFLDSALDRWREIVNEQVRRLKK